jgi:hypothetical protein
VDAGSTPLIVFDTEGDVLFREQVLLAQLGFPGAGGILAFAPSGDVC